jgi:hypothetical protein
METVLVMEMLCFLVLDSGTCLQSMSVKMYMKMGLVIWCILNFEKQGLTASCLAAWKESTPAFNILFFNSAEKIQVLLM